MENNVRGIRDVFYNDLIHEYQTEQNSFLYRYFLAESVKELQKKLKKSLEEESQDKPGKSLKEVLQNKPGKSLKEESQNKPGKSLKEELQKIPEESLEERLREKPGKESAEELPKNSGEAVPEQELLWPEVGFQIWPEDVRGIRNHLRDVMKKHKEWIRGLLLREPPGKKDKRERRDFWEELWLNDAGYQAGLITDREYYLWLVEYLEARDIYYKDVGVGENLKDAHVWLYKLLYEGLRGTEYALAREDLVKKEGRTTVNIRTKSQVEGDLKKLAELMRSERSQDRAEQCDARKTVPVQDGQDERQADPTGEGRNLEQEKAVDRLHHLKKKIAKGRDIWYLLWLTQHLERMAMHIKIKTWLQDSGYPFKVTEKEERTAKEPRKQDFSMRLFETYLDNHYDFVRKNQGGRKALEKWHKEGEFCVADRNLAETLLSAVRESEKDAVYIPLAVHMFTGCVFFLAGKENYRELYEKGPGKKWKKDYEDAEGCCCFDYLRLDDSSLKDIPDDSNPEDALNDCSSGDILGAMRMGPFYHKNAGKDYDTVINNFKRYCRSEDSPLQAVKTWNGEKPKAIPNALRWAFDSCEITERRKSSESVAKFIEIQENAGKAYPF